jgi:peptidoglycan/LPS O-acetylase OafA/YrhL
MSAYAMGSGVSEKSDRIYGLDIFRSLAILFVLLGHGFEHSVVTPQLQVFGRLGVLGVELFFVLSGFLIGGIIMRLIEKDEFHSIRSVSDFWTRRWLRTLPLYFVALLAFLRFDYHGRHGLLDYPSYYFFMQSFAYKIPEFFELSWSLAIEEHFYLWFPLVFLVWSKLTKRSGLSIVLSSLTFVAIAYAYRFSQPIFSDWNEYNRYVRLPVLSRIDAIMYGVLMAAAKHYCNGVFQWIRRGTPLYAMLFVVLCVWWFSSSPHLMTSRAVQLNIFTLQSVLCALLLPWFDGKRNCVSSSNFFVVTSRLSYSLYLVHILVIIFVNRMLGYLGLFDLIYQNPFVLYTIYLSLAYFLSWVTYGLIEEPFLSLRDEKFSLGSFVKASWFALTVAGLLIFVF